MEIREVRDGEHEVAGELVVEAYRQVGGPPVDDNGYADELRDVASRARGAVVLVAVDASPDGGRVVGCVTYVPDETSPYAELLGPGEAGIRMLAVDPEVRRRGIGQALVEACLDRARREGKRRVCLHSGEWMHAAHALYDAMGFRRTPERDWLPEPDIPLLGFAYDLAGAPDEPPDTGGR